MARCPHCQASLPEAATFCAACGRRIEGWRAPPRAEGGPQSAPLPGGEEPTRHLAPTPSLLRVAALGRNRRAAEKSAAKNPSKPGPAAAASSSRAPTVSGPVETDSALLRAVRSGRVPLALALVAVGFTAAAGAFFLVRRQALPPTVKAAVAPAPKPSSAPALLPGPRAGATETASAPSALRPARPAPAPHRLAALTVTTRAKHPRVGRVRARHDRTGLPMKVVTTDSRAQPKAPAPVEVAAQRPAPAAPAEITAAPLAAPAQLSDDELKQKAEASIDADGVRFVVKAHLPQVHACYERAFKESSPGGRVEIGFAIDAQGRAVRIRTEVNTTDSEPLARCLEQRVGQWQFPHPVGGDYDLVYPFVFSAGS